MCSHVGVVFSTIVIYRVRFQLRVGNEEGFCLSAQSAAHVLRNSCIRHGRRPSQRFTPSGSLPAGAAPCLPAELPGPLAALTGGRTSSLVLTVGFSCGRLTVADISQLLAFRVACRVQESSESLGGPVLSELGSRCQVKVPPCGLRREQESGMPGRDLAK